MVTSTNKIPDSYKFLQYERSAPGAILIAESMIVMQNKWIITKGRIQEMLRGVYVLRWVDDRSTHADKIYWPIRCMKTRG